MRSPPALTLDETHVLEMAERALATPCGMRFRVENPTAAKTVFYKARAKVRLWGDTRFDVLSFFNSPERPDEVWVMIGVSPKAIPHKIFEDQK